MKQFLLTVALLATTISSYAAPTEDYLPDIVSPDELREELGLPEVESSDVGDEFELFSLDDWNSANGVDITQLYKVVVVVNKAAKGKTAQRATVYVDGKLFKTYTVSTGRETPEKSPSGKVYHSITPTGWYQPTLFSPNHYSKTWKAPMPWSVFFVGGIALHATTQSHYADLGRRASGGCVRFTYNNAKELYHIIKNAGSGSVPQFTKQGQLIRDEQGNLVYQQNYNTLIIVENKAD